MSNDTIDCPFFTFLIFIVLWISSVCHRGYFNCSYTPCPAVCTVYSDRHYHTFDGLEYDYHTDCQIYLLKVSDYGLLLHLEIWMKKWILEFFA